MGQTDLPWKAEYNTVIVSAFRSPISNIVSNIKYLIWSRFGPKIEFSVLKCTKSTGLEKWNIPLKWGQFDRWLWISYQIFDSIAIRALKSNFRIQNRQNWTNLKNYTKYLYNKIFLGKKWLILNIAPDFWFGTYWSPKIQF